MTIEKTAKGLVLWDSRCVHCSAPGRYPVVASCPESEAAPAPPELLRIVSYVCMTPKQKATPEVLQQRREAYRDRLTTSHWAHLFSPVRAGKMVKAGAGPPLDIDDEEAVCRRRLIA